MKTAAMFKVVTKDGSESLPMSKAQAKKIAKWLRTGSTGRGVGSTRVSARVVAA